MRVKCSHCGYKWFTKKEKVPKACPSCKQYNKIKEIK